TAAPRSLPARAPRAVPAAASRPRLRPRRGCRRTGPSGPGTRFAAGRRAAEGCSVRPPVPAGRRPHRRPRAASARGGVGRLPPCCLAIGPRLQWAFADHKMHCHAIVLARLQLRARNRMKYPDTFIDSFENTSSEPVYLHGIMRLNPGARVIKSTIRGPLFLNKNSQVGPDVVAGKYFGMNE